MSRLFRSLVVAGLWACSNPTEPLAPEYRPIRDLRLPAGVTIGDAVVTDSGGVSRIALALRNHSSSEARIEYGLCTFSLVAYATPTYHGSPVWHEFFPDFGCVVDFAMVVATAIPPGETRSVRLGTLPAEALRDPITGAQRYLLFVLRVQGEPDFRRLTPLQVQGGR